MLAALSACDGKSPFSALEKTTELSKKEKALISLALSMERGGDLKEAETLYKEAMEESRGNVTAHLGLADLYFRQGKEKEAADLLAKAEAKQPDNAQLNQILGKLHIQRGKPEAALAYFERGLKTQPDNVAMLNGKGIALDSLSRHEDAVKAYEAALQKAKGEDMSMVNNNLALSHIMSGKYDDAIALLEPLVEKEDSVTMRQNLALAYGLKGDLSTAGVWAGKDMEGEKLTENIRFYRQYHDNRILQAVTPAQKPAAPAQPVNN